jgi:hypothetical protein
LHQSLIRQAALLAIASDHLSLWSQAAAEADRVFREATLETIVLDAGLMALGFAARIGLARGHGL